MLHPLSRIGLIFILVALLSQNKLKNSEKLPTFLLRLLKWLLNRFKRMIFNGITKPQG